MWDLLRDIEVELLEDLWAENSISLVPKLAQDTLRSCVLGIGITVMSVNQHIRVDERSIAHAARPDSLVSPRPCENLFREAP